ncbi:MAG: PilC/PilY family type IV pilus protein [Woeseiaceae bacterium]|nr:PilC/PilY family type IV pilus protein [Woeseiaceae bacterium]
METLRQKLLLMVVVAATTSLFGSAYADDTDIYIDQGNVLPPESLPMVMFSLDYRPNLGSTACNGNECDTLIAEGYMSPTGPYVFFDVLRGALRKVMDPLEGVKVGLMLNHDNRNNCEGYGRTGCSNGGYIAMGFKEFTVGDTNGAKAEFHGILSAMPTPQGNMSHSFQGKELFFEFFRYLTGQGVYNAHNGWTDYGTNNQQNLDQEHPGSDWDKSIENPPMSKPTYETPFESGGECSKVFTVNPLFFVANQEDDSDAAIAAPIINGGFGSPQDDFADVIRYMYDADLADGNYGSTPNLPDQQNVTSYFMVDPNFINTTTIGYAQAGGTGAPLELSENPDELVATLQEIFKQILSVSTTFVAASVPVNVFNRAEVTDNVYLALFQVDKGGRPAWVGNVKKLKLVGANSSTANAALVDALGQGAVAADGRLRFDALTHWTVPDMLPAPDLQAGEVTGRDGRTVGRGGSGQKIPGFLAGSPQSSNGVGGRTIYYDRTPTTLASLNVDMTIAGELQSDLNAASISEAATLLAYARGLDVDDLDGDNVKNEAREWLFGDALHSRPLPINFGTRGGYSSSNPAIYLAVGSNDGTLRMIRNTTTGGAESGEEVWAFMPRAAMPAQKIMRTNSAATAHPYTIDGAPVAYIEDKDFDGNIESGDRVWIFFGMRRGGKSYYALDVSNPEAPRLMWTINKSGDFGELGLTFSNPRVGLVDAGSGPVPAVFFGGGYDVNKDDRSGVGTDDSEGNAIYVVNAETGDLIWKARGGGAGASGQVFEHPGLVDSIPSALTVADTDGDGLTDRIVVGDTGGNVWRADLEGDNTSDWKLSLLASLGRHASGAGGKWDDRRFFHRPDMVQTKDDAGNFDAIIIGSGDRADPLDKAGPAGNWMFMIKDRGTAVGAGTNTGIEIADLGDVTDNCLQEGANCGIDLNTGWKLQLESLGEKVLATALTISGSVFFTSYIPPGGGPENACTPSEGGGKLYAVSLQNASAVINYDTSDDPDDPDAGDGEAGTTKADRDVELKSLGIPAEVVSIPPNKILRPDLQIDTVDVATRWRTYWYLHEDTDL